MKITSLERKVLVGAWFAACLWNAFIGFIIFMEWRGHPPSSFGLTYSRDWPLLIFAAGGIALLAWAIRETVLWKIYGPTFFVSDMEIIRWASKIDGRILFPRPLPASIGRQFRLTLLCQYQDDKNLATVWQDAHLIDISGEVIPVSFSLPTETKPSPLVLPSRMILRLKAKEVEGGFQSFAAEYVLPFEGAPNDAPFAERKREFERRRSEV